MAQPRPPGPGPPGGGTPQKQPHFALPEPTPEEALVQKRQGEFIQGDVRTLTMLDTAAPFHTLHDAVHKLLPFHLLAAADPSEADLDDTADHEGAQLTASRHEAWQELCLSKANDLRRRADHLATRIEAMEQHLAAEAVSGARPLDRFAMARVQQEHLKHKVEAERAVLARLMPAAPPPPPSVAPAPVAVRAAAGAQRPPAPAAMAAAAAAAAAAQGARPPAPAAAGAAAAAVAAVQAAAAAAAKAGKPGLMVPPAGAGALGGLALQQLTPALLRQLPPATAQQLIIQQQLLQQAQAQAQAAQQQGQPGQPGQPAINPLALLLQQQQQQQQLALLQQQQLLQAQAQAQAKKP